MQETIKIAWRRHLGVGPMAKASQSGSARRKRPTRRPASRIKKWAPWSPITVEHARKILVDAFIVLVIVIGIVVVLKTTLKAAVRFEPISVPKELVDRGLTGEVAANRIVDEIRRINKRATTSMERSLFSMSSIERTLPKIDTPVGGISLAPVVSYVRELIGLSDIRIAGEIVAHQEFERTAGGDSAKYSQSEYVLHLRIVDGAAVPIEMDPTENLDEIFSEGAIKVVEALQPYIAASYYEIEKRYSEARRLIRECLLNDRVDDDAWALNLRALMLYDEGKHHEAVIEFRHIAARFKKFPLAHYNLAMALSRLEKHQDAFHAAEAGIRRDSNPRSLAIGYNNASVALQRLNRYEEALNYSKLSVVFDPRASNAHLNMGRALSSLGRYQEAASAYRRETEINPENGWAFARWAFVLARIYGGARDPKPTSLLGNVYPGYLEILYPAFSWKEEGIPDDPTSIAQEAKDKIEIAVALRRGDAALQEYIGSIYEQLNNPEDALPAYENAMELDPKKYGHLRVKVEQLSEKIGMR